MLALALVVGLLLSGAHTSISPAAIREWLVSSGPRGPLLFVAAFALLQPWGLSAHVFILASALVWSPPVALALSLSGAVVASAVAFWLARWMGYEWVQSKLPARLHRWDERLGTHGFRTVLLMRLTLFTFGPMQLMLGVSKVRFAPYLAASAIGLLPMIALETFLGGGLVDWLRG